MSSTYYVISRLSLAPPHCPTLQKYFLEFVLIFSNQNFGLHVFGMCTRVLVCVHVYVFADVGPQELATRAGLNV